MLRCLSNQVCWIDTPTVDAWSPGTFTVSSRFVVALVVYPPALGNWPHQLRVHNPMGELLSVGHRVAGFTVSSASVDQALTVGLCSVLQHTVIMTRALR